MSMMMSIFSSFDALCAEFLGQKVGFSWPNYSNTKKDPAVIIDDDLKKKGKDVNSSSSHKPEDRGRSRMRAPRFAPELDGVHCFETILPY